jgi:NADH-quinone oxidoreductase subunit H
VRGEEASCRAFIVAITFMAHYLVLVAPDWFIDLAARVLSAETVAAYRGVIDYLIWPLLQIALMLFIVATLVAYLVYAERKISAFIQARLGPMRVGPWGLLQPLADLIKLISKEDFVPDKADKFIFPVAPMISVLAAFTVLAVLPFGPSWLHIADVNIGLLFVFAFSSLGVLGIIMAGWSSNSKYPLLGGLRSSAQMVSYEVGMGLAIVGALMFTQTLSMTGIIRQQMDAGLWNLLYQPLGFFVFFVCGLAETNRTPFDLPEGESEIVGGFHTEYSGFRWSLFFLAEYTAMLIVSAVAVTLYLGGWHFWGITGPLGGFQLVSFETSPNLYALAGLLVFVAKVMAVIYVFMWFRWTFPRYRYDQLMDLGWKWLTPAALANIVVTGIAYVFVKQGLGLDFTQPGNTQAKLALIAVTFVLATPTILAVVAMINRRTQTFDIAEQRRRQVQARAERQARIAAEQHT